MAGVPWPGSGTIARAGLEGHDPSRLLLVVGIAARSRLVYLSILRLLPATMRDEEQGRHGHDGWVELLVW